MIQNAFTLNDKSWVVVQMMKKCRNEEGNPLTGSFGCEMFELLQGTQAVPSTNIIQRVALIHDCKIGQCSFATVDVQSTVEREKVTKRELAFVHSDSRYYLLNKFCLNNS